MQLPPRTDCPHCGRNVEQNDYCGACGRPLAADAAPAAGRGWRRVHWRHLLPALDRLQPRQIAVLWRIAALGAVLVLIALLADEAGVALVLATCVVPAVLVVVLRAIDVFEDEPLTVYLAIAAGGFLAGLIVALANDVLADELWLDDAALNVGAAGFGGEAAEAAGSPPFGLLFLSGLAIPFLGEGLKLAGPVLLRRRSAHRNEVMDGFTLGAAAGAGFAVAGATVFVWPLIRDGTVPARDVSDWTATVLGLVAVRPLIITLIGAMLGAAVWHYGLTGRRADALGSAVPALAALLLYALGDLLLQPSGTLAELIWGVLVLAGLAVAARGTLRAALGRDRAAYGPGTGRVRCSSCGALTPEGAFCARCGSALPSPELTEPIPAAPATNPTPEPEPAG